MSLIPVGKMPSCHVSTDDKTNTGFLLFLRWLADVVECVASTNFLQGGFSLKVNFTESCDVDTVLGKLTSKT